MVWIWALLIGEGNKKAGGKMRLESWYIFLKLYVLSPLKTLNYDSKSVSWTALPEHTGLLGSLQLEAACMPLYFDFPIHYGTVVQEDWRLMVWDAHKNLFLKQRKIKYWNILTCISLLIWTQTAKNLSVLILKFNSTLTILCTASNLSLLSKGYITQVARS